MKQLATQRPKQLSLAAADKILAEYNSPEGMARLAGAMLSKGGIPGTVPVKSALKEYHAPGVYIRECFMPMNSVIVGKEHKTEHFNIIVKGVVRYIGDDGKPVTLRAGEPFISKAGRQKLLVILQDCVWRTIHANPGNLTDTAQLEELFINKEATAAALAEAAKYQGEKLALPNAS